MFNGLTPVSVSGVRLSVIAKRTSMFLQSTFDRHTRHDLSHSVSRDVLDGRPSSLAISKRSVMEYKGAISLHNRHCEHSQPYVGSSYSSSNWSLRYALSSSSWLLYSGIRFECASQSQFYAVHTALSPTIRVYFALLIFLLRPSFTAIKARSTFICKLDQDWCCL